jgi:hypothetical protein
MPFVFQRPAPARSRQRAQEHCLHRTEFGLGARLDRRPRALARAGVAPSRSLSSCSACWVRGLLCRPPRPAPPRAPRHLGPCRATAHSRALALFACRTSLRCVRQRLPTEPLQTCILGHPRPRRRLSAVRLVASRLPQGCPAPFSHNGYRLVHSRGIPPLRPDCLQQCGVLQPPEGPTGIHACRMPCGDSR